MSKHKIDFYNTFNIREPVLKTLHIGYNVIPETEEIRFDRELGNMSEHERDAVEFVLNPLVKINIFAGLDKEIAVEIVKVLKIIYLDRDGKWD